ncbi:histidine phosphatase family protein [Pseudobdellovibrio exovorus]|uniref:Phosphoglycerate mutase n=1 Tax=Pseudobdellovibrio exovorus JSS TaxID=1184267 RepID=M4V8Y8_9BACT|nr:histidine phosphatase family protein [Pseudobdellovibrio exovorus]AGH95872.1 phosphoglycerate mutase [Pseudobdellovibrio exovorus JSS]
MKCVLFRHAHKGIMPFEDPELSLQGFEQAARLMDEVTLSRLPIPTLLYVSPKRRTSQTLYPLSKMHHLNLQVCPELDQHSHSESLQEFRQRIQKWLDEVSATTDKNAVIFMCTHYDWIEEAMSLINCDRDLNTFEFSHWHPTQYVVFDIQDDLWKFVRKGTAK